MEKYECQNCLKDVELDKHGRCSNCGSNAVVSRTVLSYIMERNYEKLFGSKMNDLYFE